MLLSFHGPLSSSQKSEKSREQILRKKQKGHFGAHLDPLCSDFGQIKISDKNRYPILLGIFGPITYIQKVRKCHNRFSEIEKGSFCGLFWYILSGFQEHINFL